MFEILDDLWVLKPTIFLTVPWILNRMYDGIMKKIEQLGGIKKYLFLKAIDAKLYNYREFGVLEHFIWDRIIFNKTKEILGGKVRAICVGSAPMEPKVLELLKIAFGAPIIEGYG